MRHRRRSHFHAYLPLWLWAVLWLFALPFLLGAGMVWLAWMLLRLTVRYGPGVVRASAELVRSGVRLIRRGIAAYRAEVARSDACDSVSAYLRTTLHTERVHS